MTYLIWFIKGLVIGIGFIMPGVSGGSIAIILGVYEKILVSIRNIRKNYLFLVILGIGIVSGSILFSNLLLQLLETKEVIIKYIFMGMVLGTIPSLIKRVKKNNPSNLNLFFMLMTLSISLVLFLIENKYVNISLFRTNNGIIYMFISGIVYAFGKIVPGVSGSALMILLGLYENLLLLISNPLNINFLTLKIYTPFIIGAIFGLVVIYKLLVYLLEKYYSKTYSAILGFVIGSILFIYPGFNLLGILGLLLSAMLTYLLAK